MSDTPEQNIQADDAQAQAGGIDANADLLNKIALLEANNKKLLSEKRNASASVEEMQRQIADLQSRDTQRKQADLLANGKAEELVDQLRGTVGQKEARIAELEAQLQEKDVAAATADQGIRFECHFTGWHSQSDPAFSLLKENLRLKDGMPIALAGGVEVPLQQHLESLRARNSGWEHHFASSGARGMSAVGSSTSANGQKSWSSMGLMDRIKLENPQLAAAKGCRVTRKPSKEKSWQASPPAKTGDKLQIALHLLLM